MSTLKETLNLSGASPVEIILGTEGGVKYEEVKKLVQEKAEPILKEYLKGLKIKETLDKITTLEELEKVEITYITEEFKETLATTIDAVENITLQAKTWLFAVFLNSFYQGAAAHCDAFFQMKGQELANKSRLIKPS